MVRAKPLSALVFAGNGGLFVALCLEHDIAAQGRSADEALQALEENFRAHIRIAERRGEQPFERSKAAPKEYWTKFEAGVSRPVASATFGQVRVVEA